jgi:hypothetical protein
MLLTRGIDVSDHLGNIFGIPPPRSRRDASAALPPWSLQARWPAPCAHGALAPGGVAKRSSAADSKAVAHQGHRHSCPTVSPPPSAALRVQPLICLPGSPSFPHPTPPLSYAEVAPTPCAHRYIPSPGDGIRAVGGPTPVR